jgi:DNA-binding response OmpR family regulator
MATLKVRPIAFAAKPRLPLTGTSVLIVEDEPLIALDIHAALSAVGASIIAATSGAEALELVRMAEITVAVLDINLGDRDCSAVCRALTQRKIPFLFYTGHPDAGLLTQWPDASMLIKPAQTSVIVARVAALVARA